MIQKNLENIINLSENNENNFDLEESLRKLIVILIILLSFNFSFTQEIHKVSYYGTKFHNKKTASGEIFNMNELTCAATKEYNFGDVLKVTNIENERFIIVKVNDRGNLKKLKRTLDLSKRAFSLIGDIKKGLLLVTIEKLNINLE
jgi:rare lipoprotein A